MRTMSTIMSHIFTQEESAPSGSHYGWGGDSRPSSVIQQRVGLGLTYPLSFPCEDPAFVSGCYQNWAHLVVTQGKPVDQSLLPAAAKAHANGELDTFRN
jgi:hypothetical protein